MKTSTLFTCVISIIIPSLLFAQKDFQVYERTGLLSVGERTGYTVTIDGMDEKESAKALRNWIGEKQKKPTFEETGKHELMVVDIMIPQFGTTPADLYFLFEDGKGSVNVTGFFVVGDAFVSAATNPEKYKECLVFMRNFGMRTEKLKVMETLEAADKELGKKQNEQETLVKKNEQLNNQIEECNETIEKANADLQQNAKDQEAKKTEIATQQKVVDGVQTELKKYEGY